MSHAAETMSSVATASERRGNGITRIATAIGQMSSVAQQTASNAEESAAASVELAEQAARLRPAVERFTLGAEPGAMCGALPNRIAATIGARAGTK